MATYSITTTDDQETALVYAYEQSQHPPPFPGMPPPLVPAETQAEFFQRQINTMTLGPMQASLNAATQAAIMASLQTIPEENQPAAAVEIRAVITEQGGTVVKVGDDDWTL